MVFRADYISTSFFPGWFWTRSCFYGIFWCYITDESFAIFCSHIFHDVDVTWHRLWVWHTGSCYFTILWCRDYQVDEQRIVHRWDCVTVRETNISSIQIVLFVMWYKKFGYMFFFYACSHCCRRDVLSWTVFSRREWFLHFPDFWRFLSYITLAVHRVFPVCRNHLDLWIRKVSIACVLRYVALPIRKRF